MFLLIPLVGLIPSLIKMMAQPARGTRFPSVATMTHLVKGQLISGVSTRFSRGGSLHFQNRRWNQINARHNPPTSFYRKLHSSGRPLIINHNGPEQLSVTIQVRNRVYYSSTNGFQLTFTSLSFFLFFNKYREKWKIRVKCSAFTLRWIYLLLGS